MYHKMGLTRQKICEYVVSVSHSMVACRSERPCLEAWLVALYHYYNVDSFSTIINKMGYVCLLLLGFVCPLHSKNMWILSGFSIEYKGIWPQSFHNFSPKFNVLGKRSVIHKVPLLKSHQYYCSMNQYLPRWVVGDPLCVKLESYFFFYFWKGKMSNIIDYEIYFDKENNYSLHLTLQMRLHASCLILQMGLDILYVQLYS